MEYVCCASCGADDTRLRCRARDTLFGRPGEYTVVTCNACGLTYLNPRPTFAALGDLYPADYCCYKPVLGPRRSPRAAMSGIMGILALRRIAQLERVFGAIPREGSVLDVGCGSNAFLYHLHRIRGCNTLGLDFCAPVVEAVRERLAMPVKHGSLLDGDLEASSFDGVAMYEYLEHEGRPKEVLAAARRVTRPGGWLAVETPDADSPLARLFGSKWCQLDAPRHLVLYSRRTIVEMLTRCGYRDIVVKRLRYQWAIGFSILTAMGFRSLGRVGLFKIALGVAATLPFAPLPWVFPEFMRVYARVV